MSDGSVVATESLFLYPSADFLSLVVWDMERQHTLGQLVGHDAEITVVAARGSLAVSCQRRGPVKSRVWNLETMQCTATLPAAAVGDADESDTTACCVEGRVLLGQDDGVIKVWDVAASAPVALASLEGHISAVYDIKSADVGSMVLAGSKDTTVRLWDLRNGGRCVRTMEGHSEPVMSVDMDGHCRTAISGAEDKTAKLWDLGSGRCTETYEHESTVQDVVMHESGSSFLIYKPDCPDGDKIVSAWAVGSTRAIMQAEMSSFCVPDVYNRRMFASRDLSMVAFCSISNSQLGLSVWR